MADNFLFYKSWWDIINQHIPDRSRQNELIRAIVQYGIDGSMEFPEEVMFLQQAYAQIDSAKEKHDKRVEAGRKGGQKSRGGGAPKGNKNAKKKTTSKQQANENDNVNDNENENDNIILTNAHSSDNALESMSSNAINNYWSEEDFDD